MSRQKHSTLLVASLVSAALIASCTLQTSQTTTAPAKKSTQEIQVYFQLPEQIEWEQIEDAENEERNVIEWVVKGTTPGTTPMRVMYQKLEESHDLESLKEKMISPLEKCVDKDIQELENDSVHQQKMTFKTVCSQFSDASYGLIDYALAATDDSSTHLVLAEIRIPPFQSLNDIHIDNTKEKKWLTLSIAAAEMFEEMMKNIKICDFQKQNCR